MTAVEGKETTMGELCIPYRDVAPVSPVSPSFASPSEKEARGLLARSTPADTEAARDLLYRTENALRRGEWYFLMGICALRWGFVADALASLDRACSLSETGAPPEYHALYESVRNAFMKKKRGEDGYTQERGCFSGVDCLDCCDCLSCCDCDGSDGCCDCCDGGCDCGDCCN